MYVLMDCGMSIALGRCQYGVNIINFITKNEDSIRKSIKAGAPSSAKISGESHDPSFKVMERALCLWLVDEDVGCHGARQGGILRHAEES
jgi:hypothetical protein